MSSSVASLGLGLLQVPRNAPVLVLKKAQDAAKLQGEAAVALMEQAAQIVRTAPSSQASQAAQPHPVTAGRVDVYA